MSCCTRCAELEARLETAQELAFEAVQARDIGRAAMVLQGQELETARQVVAKARALLGRRLEGLPADDQVVELGAHVAAHHTGDAEIARLRALAERLVAALETMVELHEDNYQAPHSCPACDLAKAALAAWRESP